MFHTIRAPVHRKWIFRTVIPGVIIILLVILIIVISLITEFQSARDAGAIILLFVFAPIGCVYIITLLIAKYKKGMSYIFSIDTIEVYKKNIFQYSINISDIQTMNYYPFKLHYIVTIYTGALAEGGAWKIHITTKDQEKHSLGYISQSDARKIQQMYPNLMKIMYEKKDS